MPIAFDSASSANTGAAGAASLTWSHTVGVGSNRILLVGVSTWGLDCSASQVLYGATSLVKAVAGFSGISSRAELWYLLAPPEGTQTITVDASCDPGYGGNPTIVGGAVSYFNVVQTAPSGAGTDPMNLPSCAANTACLTVPSATGNIVVDVIASEPIPGPAGPGQAARWNVTVTGSDNAHGAGSQKDGAAGGVTMSWGLTYVGGGEWAMAGVSLQPAATNAVALSSFSASAGAALPLTLATTGVAIVAVLMAWRGRSRRRGN